MTGDRRKQTVLIFAVVRDSRRREELRGAIAEAAPGADVRDFPDPEAVRAAMEESLPDAVFLGIGGEEGLDFAGELKALRPAPRVILIAETDALAARAYELHVEGYVIRPFTRERVREEIGLIPAAARAPRRAKKEPDSPPARQEKLQIRCFGSFAVFWQGRPLVFRRKKTTELLAFLVDRRGAACSAEEAIDALYEETRPDEMNQAKQKLRNLIFELNAVLGGIGQREILIRTRNTIAIWPEGVDCDYYRMLEGDPVARRQFEGEYMEQYSWAESTKGKLTFSSGKNIE